MKRLVITTLLLLTAGTVSAAEIVEAIIARVGDRIITRSQYEKRLSDGLEQIERAVPPEQVEQRKKQFRETLLDEMLSELLIKDRADRLGLTISEDEVRDAIGRLKQQYGIESDEQFEASLREAGLTRREMEKRLRDTLLSNKVFARELRPRGAASDAELRERYEREKERYRLPERAIVREIVLVRPEADPSTEEVLRQRAAEAARRARTGEDFAALVAEFSEAPTKGDQGRLGEVAKGELIPSLDDGVFRSDAGAIVGPIETRFGWHILMIEQRLPSMIPSFDSVRDRLRQESDDEAFQRDYQAYIDRLRGDAIVRVHEENLPQG